MKKVLLVLGCAALLPSCSVVMAARKDGASLSQVQTCRTRAQLIALGGTVQATEHLPTGELVEIYRFQKERGSAVRAIMHGLLDMSSFFLWEIAGTPIEGSLGKKEYFTIRVTYDADNTVRKVEML